MPDDRHRAGFLICMVTGKEVWLMDDRELCRHSDSVNELLARYGVKFGIKKIMYLRSSFFRMI